MTSGNNVADVTQVADVTDVTQVADVTDVTSVTEVTSVTGVTTDRTSEQANNRTGAFALFGCVRSFVSLDNGSKL